MSSKKMNLGIAYSIGAIWFGSHVGGGFASGNQAWNFMGRFGSVGILVSIFAMVLVGVAGREILLSAKIHKSGVGKGSVHSHPDLRRHLLRASGLVPVYPRLLRRRGGLRRAA